jgi:hypothetical protein
MHASAVRPSDRDGVVGRPRVQHQHLELLSYLLSCDRIEAAPSSAPQLRTGMRTEIKRQARASGTATPAEAGDVSPARYDSTVRRRPSSSGISASNANSSRARDTSR